MNKLMLVLLIVLLISCDEDESRSFQVIDQFSIGVEETVIIQDNDIAFPIRLDEIRDSRCPANANCFSAGSVHADFTFNNSEEATLCLGECNSKFTYGFQELDSVQFIVGAQKYWLKLLEVTPYPVSPDISGNRATVVVSK